MSSLADCGVSTYLRVTDMRMPKTIKVGANTVTVRLVKEVDEHRNIGEFDPANMGIKISSKLGTHQRALTLLHECLHACWWDAGLTRNKITEEEVVSGLEGRLGALIRDNPKLIDYWKENLK